MAQAPAATTKGKGGRPDTSKMDKAGKFAFLANQRMGKSLAQLKNLKRLANARNYEFKPEQVARIRSALNATVKDVCDAFDIALKGGANVAETSSFDVNAKE